MTRIIYCDESGRGNIKADPTLVLAGVMVHADDQRQAIEKYLDLMYEDCARFRELPEGFCFHAKDIYHGTKHFHRDTWPREVREKLLDELLGIPAQFGLPIVFGTADRAHIAELFPDEDSETQLSLSYQRAAMSLMMQAQAFMLRDGDNGEVAIIVFENVERAPKALKALHKEMRDADSEMLKLEHGEKYLPVDRLVDTPFFAEKHETSLLQLADACAFAIKRKLQRARDWERYYTPVQQQCVFLHKDELDEANHPNLDRIKYTVVSERE
ncbi:MAG: DUF3800 domain-containing protein [Pseudomonadota bacterium]